MKRACLASFAIAFLLAAAGASAQQYKWVDKDGRIGYGDVPPPGARVTRLRPPPGPSSPAAEASPGASLSKREEAFRKRREEAAKASEKSAAAAKDEETKKRNCARAREYLRTLESGQRITRTDEKGERYFLDEGQIARETAQARRSVGEWCE